jgi:hypothetical protein
MFPPKGFLMIAALIYQKNCTQKLKGRQFAAPPL